jgi:hypothetical protein
MTNYFFLTHPLWCRALEEKAREYNIQDLEPLFASPVFTSMGFQLDQDQHAILCPM